MAIIMNIMNNYTHHNGNSYEDWSTIDNFNGNNTSYTYYQTVNGQSRPQKYEFTVYWDETTIAEKSRLDRTNENPAYFVNNSAGWLDSLKAPMSVTKALVDIGYERGKSIFGAPYDFRKAPNEQDAWFKLFKTLIMSAYRVNGMKAVILVSHSMGSPMISYFKQWQLLSLIERTSPEGRASDTL